MVINIERMQQLVEAVHSEGWYTQAEEFQKLLDAYKELQNANASLSDKYEALRTDVIVPGIKANDTMKVSIRRLRDALDDAASLRESDLDRADDYVKQWRKLILIKNRA